MTTEPEQASDPARRKFDDVASLFGQIVPPPGAPGAPLRSRPAGPLLPTLLPDAAPPPVVPPAPSEPEMVVETRSAPPVLVPAIAPSPVLAPATPARPRPKEIPWPDAFEPRPNYRKSEPRNWSWMLLVPIGLTVAYGVTQMNPRTLKSWVDNNLLHRSAPADNQDLGLSGPFPRNWVAPGPVPGFSPSADPVTTPALPTSLPPGTPAPPAAPATPSATAPLTATPSTTTPAPAPVAPTQVHVTLQYRRGIPGAEGEARRLAALLQSNGGSVELQPATATAKVPTIQFYDPADRKAAVALAAALSNEATGWSVVQGTAKNPPGSIDVLMP